MTRKKQQFYNDYDTRNIKPGNVQAPDNPSTVDNILKQVQKEQDNSGKWTKQSTKLINSAGTLMGNGKKNGDISDIIDYFRTENSLLIPQDGDPSIIGTSMPFQLNWLKTNCVNCWDNSMSQSAA